MLCRVTVDDRYPLDGAETPLVRHFRYSFHREWRGYLCANGGNLGLG